MAISCVVLYLIPNLIYWLNFREQLISDKSADWGVYGDFIGGSLNPFLQILSIAALIYLTYTVSHVEDKRAKANIEAQKIITLTQMRGNAVVEISKLLDMVTDTILGTANKTIHQNPHITLGIVSYKITTFKENYYYLFEKLYTEEFLTKYYYPLDKLSEDLFDFYTSAFGTERGDLMTLLESYGDARSALLKEMNKFILKEME